MPSFGLNSEPSCPLCGAKCNMGYAHSRLNKWSLRALICQNKKSCGVAFRSIWRSTKLQKMTRFYGSSSLSNICSRVKDLDFSGAKVNGLSAFNEVVTEQEAEVGFFPVQVYSRGWQATHQHNDLEFDVKLTIEAFSPRLKHPLAYQNAIIECGESRLIVPLSGAWLGTTTDVDVFQNAILSLIYEVVKGVVAGDCEDLASWFSWDNIAGFDKDLMHLVVPLVISRQYHDIWANDVVDESEIIKTLSDIAERLKETFDVFEIEDLVLFSRVGYGKRKFNSRNVSMYLGKAFLDAFD